MRRKNGEQREIAYHQEYLRVIARAQGKYIFDYGCGDGSFLSLFEGWDRYGVEVSDYCIEQCQQKGIKMMESWDMGSATFDLIVFRGVLQHIDQPFTALQEAARLLRKGGTLAILAQPDADSLCYRLFGELPALDPPRNWWIPGRRELVNILGKLGFGGFEILRPYWGGPYAQPLRDFWRFALRLAGIKKPFAFPGNMIELYAKRIP
jgi:SAM-dependent methyltransferase